MEQINVINVPFYSFVCENSLVDDVYKDITSKKFAKDSLEQGNILFDYYHENLFKFFNLCINEVKKIYYKDNLEFPIVDCWVNEYLPMNNLHRHHHPNSVICGLFYVTSHDNTSPTIFEYKNPWTQSNIESVVQLTCFKNSQNIVGEIYPVQGTLILFPSSIFHYMKTIQPKHNVLNRYTIAFNTFPSGVISSTGTTKLELKPISLADKKGIKP